ncbi:MAG: DUF6273 domain-containing protein [Erysipelotrichaceae bacterium]|nr:DUF6273 domain-containing protein [Erysipelotrichaceae bacterium]
MKNNKKLIITLTIVGVLLVSLGTTYALLIGWSSRISKNSSLVVGDIYMHYNEGNKQISITDAMPSNTYSNDYFEFTIDGKNTSNKNIIYEIVLNHGDDLANKTRILDKFLAFKLVEVNDNQENVLFDNNTYRNINNTKIYISNIPSNTSNYLKTYRLYIKIKKEVVIGDVDQDYTIDEWNNIFASIKVDINGDFTDKKLSDLIKLEVGDIKVKDSNTFNTYLKLVQTDTCKTYLEEDGITYVSGSQDCINFNYVWYSGKLWRITAINPDGTMKMITDDVITSISYNPDSDVNFYDISKKDDTTYTGSYMYQWLNEDFLDTLYNYQNIIVEDSTWNITNSNASSTSAISTKLPQTTLINNSTIGKNAPVGLLNSYEYYLSYKNTSYDSGYLNIGYYWWLLNPYSSSNVWSVISSGNADDNGYPSNFYGARPSINLKSNIVITGGSGTKDDPYTISGDKEKPTINTTLLNTRTIGEYVVFDEDGDSSTKEIYRIVGIEDGKTKLNKNDYIKSGTTTLTKKFSTNATYGSGNSDEYWEYYLNNIWYNSLVSKSMLDKGTYYIKQTVDGASYKNSLCNTNNTTETTKSCVKTTSVWNTGYVGLPRYGEMFASQQGNGYKSSSDIWLITPYNSFRVHGVDRNGSAGIDYPSNSYGARPSIYLKSNVVITGGSGTKTDPFTIALKD